MLSILPKIFPKSDDDKWAEFDRSLIRAEAEIGGKLFGPVPKGHERQFFCLDRNTWIWHEEWTDENGKHRVVTTRYDVRPTGIIKSQDGQGHQLLSEKEARHLAKAAELYYRQVSAMYDAQLQAA